MLQFNVKCVHFRQMPFFFGTNFQAHWNQFRVAFLLAVTEPSSNHYRALQKLIRSTGRPTRHYLNDAESRATLFSLQF